MKTMQAQNAQLQDTQQKLAQALQEAEIEKKRGDASNAEARANLAMAQAYKAVLDARSRAKDVDSKDLSRQSDDDQQEFDQIVELVQDHNAVQHEDRDFELREKETKSREMEHDL
jgi:hypothetical protein